jgi:hypothetical protein
LLYVALVGRTIQDLSVANWVKLIGASDLPVPNAVFREIPSLAELVRFPKGQFPTDMRKGDALLYYAVGGYKKVFAASIWSRIPGTMFRARPRKCSSGGPTGRQ